MAGNRCQLLPCHILQIVSFAPKSACRESRKSHFSTAVFFLPTFPVTSLSSPPPPPPTTFCNNEFVSEGRSEQRSWRRKKGKEKESERERNREKVRDKGADGMDAKNQQSHVRTIKINSFSLHSPHPSLSRLEGTQSVI